MGGSKKQKTKTQMRNDELLAKAGVFKEERALRKKRFGSTAPKPTKKQAA